MVPYPTCSAHIGLISSHLTQSGLDHTLLHMPCTHVGLISSHLMQSGLDYTLLIGLISSHLTQSGLDHTLPRIQCTHQIDFQPFDTSRQVWSIILSPHAMYTHRIDFQPFDTIRFGLYPPPRAMHTHLVSASRGFSLNTQVL